MLLQVIEGQREPHDKDHYTNKRLRVSGDLMEDLFRVFINKRYELPT